MSKIANAEARPTVRPNMADIQLDDIRRLLVENCMLRVAPEEIQLDTALFGPDSLNLDSIDALQLTVGIEKTYGIAIKDPATARAAFMTVKSLQQFLATQPKSTPPAG